MLPSSAVAVNSLSQGCRTGMDRAEKSSEKSLTDIKQGNLI